MQPAEQNHKPLSEAMRAVVQALGGARKVGGYIRPDKPLREAEHWVLNTLNPSRRERMAPEHFLWLLREGRKIGRHDLMKAFCVEAGYQEPHPIDSDAELKELLRQRDESLSLTRELDERISRLTERREAA